MHHGATHRRDVDAPERFRWDVQGQPGSPPGSPPDASPPRAHVRCCRSTTPASPRPVRSGRRSTRRRAAPGPVRSATPRGRRGRRPRASSRATVRNRGRPTAAPAWPADPATARFGGRAARGRRVGGFPSRDAESGGRLGLSAADVVERFVGRKAFGRHRVGHRVRHQGQPDDLGHAAILDARPLSARSPSSRPASGAKTRPMVTHSSSWVASDSNLNS